MDLKDRLYQATSSGLDIILMYYPQARDAVDGGKHFRLRDERTPSASVKLIKGVWCVTDFGDDGRARTPIDIAMAEEGLTFGEALHRLCARFGVTDDRIRESNRPDIRRRAASPDEADGQILFETEETMTPEQLRLLGPRVSQADCDSLHWHVARSVSSVKNREVTTKLSTPTYPIFIRDCAVEDKDGNVSTFYKIYEPLNPDKGYRFMYAPRGAKPQGYINGLWEIKAQYAQLNDTRRKEWEADPINEGREYRDEKLPEVFICSGERDALCVRSMGYWPVWFNSETADIRREDMDTLLKYAATVYNIPDIDATGRRRGTLLALQYIDMLTVWLPDELLSYRDSRGRPRKDLRDWCEVYSTRAEFKELIAGAVTARFWDSWRNEKSGRWQYAVGAESLLYFLELNGFRRLVDESSGQTSLIRVDGHVIRHVEASDITDFIIAYARDFRHPLPLELRSLLLVSDRLSPAQYARLAVQPVDLSNNTGRDYQYYFFENCAVRVTADGIDDHPADRDAHFVFDERQIPHRFRPLPPMFNVTWQTGSDGDIIWDIDIPDIDSCGSCSLKMNINTSRLHWRKGWEQAFQDEAERDAWHAAHRFDIADPFLSEGEIQEQKMTLISKLYAIGYLMHRYKDLSRPWALLALDNKMGELGEANGGSGKSLFFNIMKVFQHVEVLRGRERMTDNRFLLERVNDSTDLIHTEDCARDFALDWFYDLLTGDMVINPKNNRSFVIPFERSPKMAFSTNYVPVRTDTSTSRRSLYVIFSDWYHHKTESNDYRETRQPRDDFGKNILCPEYTEDDWNWDLNFYLQCLHLYLRLRAEDQGLRPDPDTTNIVYRRDQQNMGANFIEWSRVYFDPSGTNVNRRIVRQEAFDDYLSYSHLKWTSQKFMSALRSFASVNRQRYVLNPPAMRSASDGRIIGRENGKTVEYIYMQYIGPAPEQQPEDRPGAGDPETPLPVEEPLPF